MRASTSAHARSPKSGEAPTEECLGGEEGVVLEDAKHPVFIGTQPSPLVIVEAARTIAASNITLPRHPKHFLHFTQVIITNILTLPPLRTSLCKLLRWPCSRSDSFVQPIPATQQQAPYLTTIYKIRRPRVPLEATQVDIHGGARI